MPVKIHKMQYTPVPQGVIDFCNGIHFRQSLVKQYMTCPQQALYDGIMGMGDTQQMMAAILGTAGHKVIYDMHNDRNFAIPYTDICEMFSNAFYAEVSRVQNMPRVGVRFQSIDEQLAEEMPTYASFIIGYARHKDNLNFHSTIHEQSFVLIVSSGVELSPGKPEKPFIFTGQIDQGGYDDAGQFQLRDIKFRVNQFRPSFKELSIDIQFSMYAYAMRYGVPACENCKPQYSEEDYEIIYEGPCDDCSAKIGTAQWPQKYPEKCRMVWMRDFETRDRDEHPKFIKDPQKRKVPNPSTGRMVIRDIINPKWASGGKVGDFAGEGFIDSFRRPAQLEVLMSDIIRAARSIRNGVFFRHPEKNKCYFCRHVDACRNQIETESDMHSVQQLNPQGIVNNPFDE